MDTDGKPKSGASTFLVQEFCEGGTLQDMLNKQMSMGASKLKAYTEADALEWLIDIATGLRYLHESSPSIIHRDMKLGAASTYLLSLIHI